MLDVVAGSGKEACARLPVRVNFCQAWQMACLLALVPEATAESRYTLVPIGMRAVG
jgi:hypothetical protein